MYFLVITFHMYHNTLKGHLITSLSLSLFNEHLDDQFSMLIPYTLHYMLIFFLDIYLVHECGWYRKGLGSKNSRKMRFHGGEWACCGIHLDAAASATRKLDAAASNSNATASTRPENCLCISTCQNFEKSPFNIEKDFKVIPLGEVP